MRTVSKFMMMALVLGLSGLAAVAQNNGNPGSGDGPPDGGPPGGGPGPRGHRPPMSPLVRALDVNHDGIISAEEISNAPAELLMLDKNHDGQLTPDEYRPKPPRARGGGDQGPPPDATGGPGRGTNGFRPPMLPLLKALDVNGDGIISADEIANAPVELLTLDKNHDGQLTRDEYLPPRPDRAHGGHRPPPGGQNGNGPDDGQGPPPGMDNGGGQDGPPQGPPHGQDGPPPGDGPPPQQ
jgi:hypothetical protein